MNKRIDVNGMLQHTFRCGGSYYFCIRLPPDLFLCWDRGNGDVPPELDTTLLCSSRVGSYLGLESGLVEELCQLGFIFISSRGIQTWDLMHTIQHLTAVTSYVRLLGYHGRWNFEFLSVKSLVGCTIFEV